jgi:hypothetical protein
MQHDTRDSQRHYTGRGQRCKMESGGFEPPASRMLASTVHSGGSEANGSLALAVDH